ncbi:hypothetical protein POPTR_003G061000v4 [Populus trichocarpa]|uniref:Transmembrane protein n=1 Tax=Populus trichocarpa TaxID=3694 RepID=A0A2K2B2B2_POPTR|nr:hypothetical protein POPTR_003G061000v4 [Populus trichocarpa]
MTGNSLKSIMVTLFIFAMVLSPILPSAEAGRLNYRGLQSGPICPTCVCCSPPPPGSCCPCCSTPIEP